jgi:hypothetical protein
MIETLIAVGLASAAAATGRAVQVKREQRVTRRLQDIEFERLMRSQQIHHTVASARKAMVDEVRRSRS